MERKKHLAWLLRSLLAVMLLSGCASPPAAENNVGSTKNRVWPAPPATPRIRFVRSIANPQDMGIKKSFFRRLMNRFSGSTGKHFVRPSGVAQHNGVLYIADPGAHAVWILDPAGKRFTNIQQIAGNKLVSPVAVTVRADGAVFVADTVLKKIFLLDRQGKFLDVMIEGGLQRPAGLTYDNANGRLYVADSAAQRVLVYDAGGDKLFSWGERGSAAGEFNFPTYLALGLHGELLVTDALNFRVQAFDPRGNFLWQFGSHGDRSGSFASPKGLAVDNGGHVFVVDALFDAIQLFDPDGTYLMSFGKHGSSAGQFWLPGGLYIDSQDHVFVADAYNRRIQEFAFLKPLQSETEEQQP